MYMSSITCEYSKIQCIYLYYAIYFKYIRYIYILSLLLLFFLYNNYWQDQKAGVVDQGQFQLLQSHQPWCPWAEFRALWSEGPCRQRCTQESFLCKRWHTVLAPSTDKLSSLRLWVIKRLAAAIHARLRNTTVPVHDCVSGTRMPRS